MKVVSLFDGMACGLTAFKRAGIQITSYVASEIDKFAIEISKKNHPEIIHAGDVVGLRQTLELFPEMLGEVDMLIGGSPCQGFSFAGKQLNFNDPRSKLFFEFVKIKEILKPKYFLLENVKMKKEYQDVVSNHLGVEPIEINSSLVSAQSRKRLYWTNIPGVTQPKDKGIYLKDIIVHNLYGGFKEKKARVFLDKSPTLRTSAGGGHIPSVYLGELSELETMSLEQVRAKSRKLTPEECERLQTMPEGYTEGASNTQRYKMIGNGWTVDVITHILSYLLKV